MLGFMQEDRQMLKDWAEYGEKSREKDRQLLLSLGFLEEDLPMIYQFMSNGMNPHQSFEKQANVLIEFYKKIKK